MMGPTGPGPWDPAYGYPQGTGPSTGTPAPQPPPDPTPATTQARTPQPPTVDQKPPPPPSLGDVTKDLGAQPALDINKNFETYLDLQKRAMAGSERPYLSESSKPGLLANILSFGMAGLMDRDYRQAYNSAIDSHNAKVHAEAVKNALTMVGDDVRGHSGDIGTQIRMLGLYQQMLNAQNTQLYRDQVLRLREQGVHISGERLGIAERERLTHEMMAAPDEKGKAILDDNELKYVEDPRYPGHGWAVPKNSPFGGTGAKPGDKATAPSPANTATPPPDTSQKPAAGDQTAGGLGTSGTTKNGIPYRVVGQPGAPTAANQPPAGGRNPADPNEPGISKEEQYRRKLAAEKTAAQPLPPEVQKNVAMVNQSLSALDELEKLAQDPEVQQYLGPAAGRWAQLKYTVGKSTSDKVDRYIQLAAYINTQGVGQFLHGSRNEKIWQQIQAHFPKVTDEPKLVLGKIRQARQIYEANRGFELESAGITRGQAGATAP